MPAELAELTRVPSYSVLFRDGGRVVTAFPDRSGRVQVRGWCGDDRRFAVALTRVGGPGECDSEELERSVGAAREAVER